MAVYQHQSVHLPCTFLSPTPTFGVGFRNSVISASCPEQWIRRMLELCISVHEHCRRQGLCLWILFHLRRRGKHFETLLGIWEQRFKCAFKQAQHSLNYYYFFFCTLMIFDYSVINMWGFLPLSLQSINTWSEFSRVKSAAAEQMQMSSLISSERKETQVFKCKSFPKIPLPALQACDLHNAQQQSGKCRMIWLSEKCSTCLASTAVPHIHSSWKLLMLGYEHGCGSYHQNKTTKPWENTPPA